ncbi:hypothetical protein K402DRAFT_419654 [Aulographum hederae CBS 113979]|uniref:Uncharacterized protein n=1 Tax=Aulographum hederae CBS 113979 TaxID=1176131 RepID=A0A6G1H515_9PEZI|nr:hypothetical protein K402DRAFT_419654 [Aulographum hederae CBS 113979]
MSAVNGAPTPPNPSKRKRSQTPVTSTASHSAHPTNGQIPQILEALLKDVVIVLKHNHPIGALIFDHPIPLPSESSVSPPSPKRAKLAEPPTTTISVSRKISNGSYSSLTTLVKDLDSVAEEILASVKSKGAAIITPEDTKLMANVQDFQHILHELVQEERITESTAQKNEAENGVITIPPEGSDALLDGRTTLTMFANAPQPRQLFSSLQRSVKGTSMSTQTPDDGLPNVIAATKIVPLTVNESPIDPQAEPTLGDKFGPPANALLPLLPPKVPKQYSTRGNSVPWESLAASSKSNRKGGYNYSRERLPTGDWLQYQNASKPQEGLTSEAKRRQRDRALSTGEARLPVSKQSEEAAEKAAYDALFYKVFSGSIAPIEDNAGAIIPASTKAWYHHNKTREKRYQDIMRRLAQFEPQPPFVDEETQPEQLAANGEIPIDPALEEASFKEAVDNFDPEIFYNPFGDEPAAYTSEEDEVGRQLQEISEMLEKLSSQQRIRNSTLKSPHQKSDLADLIGTPSSPGADELATANGLRGRLIQLISNLPPYAVAKLNGQQMDDVNISKKLILHNKDYKGILAEEPSRQPKPAPYSAPIAAGTPARMPSSTPSAHHPSANTPYSRVQPPANTQQARPPPQPYFPQQQPPGRAPSYHRSSSGGVQTYTAPGSYPTTQPRPSYQQPTYPSSTPRAGGSSAGPSQYFANLPAGNASAKQGYGQYYPPSQQGQQPSRTNVYQQSPSNYAQRPPNANQIYSYPPSHNQHMRTESPHRGGANTPQPIYPQSSQQRSYGTPTVPPRQFFAPTQGYGSQPTGPSGLGPSGYHSASMSSTDQQVMMERQRNQLAMSQPRTSTPQAQMVAPGPGTPQSHNSQYGNQPNGTHGANGTHMVV